MILRKMAIYFCLISKINENNSMEATDKTDLTEQTRFRQSEIIAIENYFYQEINQRKSAYLEIFRYICQ